MTGSFVAKGQSNYCHVSGHAWLGHVGDLLVSFSCSFTTRAGKRVSSNLPRAPLRKMTWADTSSRQVIVGRCLKASDLGGRVRRRFARSAITLGPTMAALGLGVRYWPIDLIHETWVTRFSRAAREIGGVDREHSIARVRSDCHMIETSDDLRRKPTFARSLRATHPQECLPLASKKR